MPEIHSLAALGIVAGVFLFGTLILLWLVVRYVPNSQVALVETLWSKSGSLTEGNIIALQGEAGYQPKLLRGGFHFFYWRWQYAFHKMNLITIRQGKLGYVFSKIGEPCPPSQTLGRVVDCNHFQDCEVFLANGGQKGRQRAILREGIYAINLAAFNVITENIVYTIEYHDKSLEEYQVGLAKDHGFDPVIIGSSSGQDNIGVVTTHDGPSLHPGEIIAPAVGDGGENFHNNFQDIEAFLKAGGLRGLQYAPLLDGSYFINRWFATVNKIPKEVIEIGHVGVVISYYGKTGADTSGVDFRHGERVHPGEKGVWDTSMGPGKYPFNTYAGKIIRVPTTNFVLHWITGQSEGHNYDDTLRSIDLITKDAYEPILPLSIVVHIDYQRASNVIQRFGDVKQLITQTLDPMLSAYFRDIAHKKTMLELIHDRDQIQAQARKELHEKFKAFDIECVDVLIGRPSSSDKDNKIELLLEQLRQRQLSLEQIETFDKQQKAAEKQGALNEAIAVAHMQTELTNSKVKINIAENDGSADLAKSTKKAAEIKVLADARANEITLIGTSEADVLQKKVESFGDSRLYAMSVLTEKITQSKQPIVPQNLIQSGDGKGVNLLEVLMSLMVQEKTQAMRTPDGSSSSCAKT